ncbi:unnamed protein product [Closterium sp. NIES-65]|nr:unnamed protein product [Closterium sp. NIES-65]
MECRPGAGDIASAQQAIALFFHVCRIPPHVAEHDTFKHMIRKVGAAGPGFHPPGRQLIMGRLLQECKTNTEKAVKPIMDSWSDVGVCIASDGWTDTQDRPQLNFLAVNTYGAIFLFGVDCKDVKKTGSFIASHFLRAIDIVGAENVVGLLMDGASNNVSASNIIKLQYPKIQFVRCAAHSLNNLMKDIGGREWAAETITKGQQLISILKNSHWITGQFREQNSLVLLKPAGTRFGTNFIALERLLKVRELLDRLVASQAWKDRTMGKEKLVWARDVIRCDEFWDGVVRVLKVFKPIYVQLRAVDGTQEVMGKIYDMMFLLEDSVRDACKDLPEEEKEWIAEAVRNRWNNSINCALHVVGRILYPPNQFENIVGTDRECSDIFRGFIRDYFKGEFVVDEDGDRHPVATIVEREIRAYMKGEGELGEEKARIEKDLIKKGKMDPAQWSNHVLPCRPPGTTVDIKKSSHKKLSKWLHAKAVDGLISGKEDKHRKEFIMSAINYRHPTLIAFLPDKTNKPAQTPAAATLDASPAAPGAPTTTTATTTTTTSSGSGSSSSSGGGLTVEEVFKPTHHVSAIFEAVGLDPHAYYSPSAAREAALNYISLHSLTKPSDPSIVILDAPLCDALYKGAIKKGAAYPTECHKRDVGPTLVRRMQAHHRVERAGKSVVRKGGLVPVQILVERRQGNKKVTRVSGLEAYLVEAEPLAAELQRKFASSTSVAEVPGAGGNRGHRHRVAYLVEADLLAAELQRNFASSTSVAEVPGSSGVSGGLCWSARQFRCAGWAFVATGGWVMLQQVQEGAAGGKKGQQEVLIQGGVLDELARLLVDVHGIPKSHIEVLDKTRR